MKYLPAYTKSRYQTGTEKNHVDAVFENALMKHSQTCSHEEKSVNSSKIPHMNFPESSEVNVTCTLELLERDTVSLVSIYLSKNSVQVLFQETQNSMYWKVGKLSCTLLSALSNKYNTK